MRHAAARLRLALALLAWLAALCLPVVHAATMLTPHGDGGVLGWCGDPARAAAVAAQLPPEIRDALGLDGIAADHLSGCTTLCALGSLPPPPTAAALPAILTAEPGEPAPPPRPAPRRRAARKPPSQGPPTQG